MTAVASVPLAQVAALNPRLLTALSDSTPVSFVPMASVSAEEAKVILPLDRPYAEVCKGYTYFETGDILVAKITPCFENGKIAQAMLPRQYGFGSTEFHVVRPDSGKLDGRYLHHFLRQAQIRVDGERRMTGSGGQRRVPEDFLARLSIPLPSLPAQHRIAAILDQADVLRAKRREALAQLDSLTQSIFTEMFGDYRTAGVPWPTQTIENLADDMTIGLVRSAAEFGPDFEVPYVRMNAIGQRGEFLPKLVMRTEVSAVEFERFELRPGDLLFNTRNSRELVGKTALFRGSGPYVYNNNLMRIRFRHGVHPEYVAAAFQTPYIQQELETRKAGTTSVFAIYARELKTVPVPVPPFHLQETFATRIQAVESLKTTHRTALAELDALFVSLQHRAFSGGL